MATGAEVVGTAFYHAFGYHTVDVYLAEIDPAALEISPEATIKDANGRRRSCATISTKCSRTPRGCRTGASGSPRSG